MVMSEQERHQHLVALQQEKQTYETRLARAEERLQTETNEEEQAFLAGTIMEIKQGLTAVAEQIAVYGGKARKR
jgi:hypothetical protein